MQLSDFVLEERSVLRSSTEPAAPSWRNSSFNRAQRYRQETQACSQCGIVPSCWNLYLLHCVCAKTNPRCMSQEGRPQIAPRCKSFKMLRWQKINESSERGEKKRRKKKRLARLAPVTSIASLQFHFLWRAVNCFTGNNGIADGVEKPPCGNVLGKGGTGAERVKNRSASTVNVGDLSLKFTTNYHFQAVVFHQAENISV